MAEPNNKDSGVPKSKRRSSLFGNARLSFFRSSGERGASVEVLRGSTGADFEAKAQVVRTDVSGLSCGCFGGKGGSESKERFVLVKGASCFVFLSETSATPKYAIPLAHLKAEVQPAKGGHTALHLMTTLGDMQYKFIFDSSKDKDVAKNFADAITRGASTGEEAEIKERLGHGGLAKQHKTKSVLYAEEVAKDKSERQPDAPQTILATAGDYTTTSIPMY
mmetsp:Transcript_47994/g.58112  ORF Transcript_47994/g.58112 Transcript_47994/m.58112 type:complete len:221 (-) Transcript_47994:199-861(-)|eukprot:CAMPEP_0172496578 /NCGR_PEP_ID=MMETSP1066-20121228/89703_1 /TAXON_ID=671091 /ORGANISM="Coscinodiscus wailesii, Strain CCMP2513" /LENGTH=220 /DNA_ID=CAMNT_0013268943 /DNA_START=71 /DNA_END=733 /DNA_ORIENTATION=+